MNACRLKHLLTAMPALCFTVNATAAQFIDPVSYLSAADSPFAALLGSALIVEDFEDGLLNQVGVGSNAGNVVGAPDVLTDSVDADDGVIDGSGSAGHSFYSGNLNAEISFTFDALAMGGLPTHAGIVWTDVGAVMSGTLGIGSVRFEAFGADGSSLGTLTLDSLGDGVANGGTAEDRFFGVIETGGISRIALTMDNSIDWEVDHLQYGVAPVPLPAAAWLLGAGIAALGLRRRPVQTR